MKSKVLLVEDDPVQAEATRKTLDRLGYDVFWEKDGIGAIKTVKAEKLDIVLLDVVLPGMGGFEVCRWLKLEESTRGVPVIMLTIRKELSDRVSGLNMGADDYLPKPYDDLELNARICALLRTKSLQDELRVKNAQLEELLLKVNQLAITDVMTGLYNRRRFHDVLAGEYERSRRYGTPFALIIMDIDHFKTINDTCGHAAGDHVLQEISLILQHSVRKIDIPFRFGGEEFVVILPGTVKGDSVAVAERFRHAVEAHAFECFRGRITVSCGIAGVPDDRVDSEEKLVKCADFALYRAKHLGRNRTITAEARELEGTEG
jgi:diguanylate cyclase (GGDEF)-like protein